MLDILPRLAGDNAPNLSRGFSVFHRQLMPIDAASGKFLSYLLNLLNGKTRRTDKAGRSAFAHAISIVIGNCSKEQVIRSDTPAIVTSVKNTKAIGDFSIGQFPSDSVRQSSGAVHEELAVSVSGEKRSFPLPALAGFINSGPESLWHIRIAFLARVIPKALARAKIVPIGMRRAHLEGFPTLRAYFDNGFLPPVMPDHKATNAPPRVGLDKFATSTFAISVHGCNYSTRSDE